MSIITLPTDVGVLRVEWGIKRFDLEHMGSDSGASQARLLAPPRWTAALIGPEHNTAAQAAAWRDFIFSLNGRVNQLALYDLGNTAPRGTMRGTLTFSASASAGATSVSITGGAGQAATTLLKGDWLGFGQSGSSRQLVSVAADATANGSGVISLTLRQPLRYAVTSGDSVTWDKPTALFRQTTAESRWSHQASIRTGYSLDLIESWEA